MKGNRKQNDKRKQGNVVLKKYMVAVDEFVKSKGSCDEAGNGHELRFVKKKSRKELRKEKRKMKKAKMKSHYEGKKNLTLPGNEGENSGIAEDKQQKRKKAKKEVSETHLNQSSPAPAPAEKTKPLPKKGKKINQLQQSRKMALLEANEEEDREIKKLERCLRLNKRKNKKSLPQSFVADGLDYILGVLDSGSSAVGKYDSDDDVDMAKENFEKLDDNDPQLSGEDEELGDEMASEGSDEDLGSLDERNEVSDDDDDDDDEEMEDEEEAEEEVMEDEDVLDGSDEADSDDEIEDHAEEEADIPDPQTTGSKTADVSRVSVL